MTRFYSASITAQLLVLLPLPPPSLGRVFGPYQIVERLGAVAYRLRLPPKACIHDVFHVVLLKRYEEDPPGVIVPLPPMLHGRVIPIPAAVVRARLNRGRWQLLVHWEGRPAADSTWEDIDDFKELYPAFQLADELFVGEEGSVIDAFVGRQYRRRPRPSRG